MKKYIIFISVIILLSLVSASRVTVNGDWKVTIRGNYGETKEGYVLNVVNNNDFPVNIFINISNQRITFNDTTRFNLEPNQSKKLSYKVFLLNNGTFKIPIIYSAPNQSFLIQPYLELKLIVNGSESISNITPLQITDTVNKTKINKTNLTIVKNSTKIENNSTQQNTSVDTQTNSTIKFSSFYNLLIGILVILIIVITYYLFKMFQNRKEIETEVNNE